MPRRSSKVVHGAFAALLVAFCVTPLLWFARAAMTPEAEFIRHPGRIVPTRATAAHFAAVLSDASVGTYLFNSLVVCVVATAIALALGTMAAYGISRGASRYRSLLLGSLLAVHLVPGMVSVAAFYRVADATGLLNTLLIVVLIKGGSLTLVVWLLVSHFDAIPRSTEEAARLDGCEGTSMVFRIVVPLAAPGLFAAGLLLFVGNWNAFFLPYVLLTDPAKMTAAVGIYQYVGEHGFDAGKIAAMTLVSIAPVLVLATVFSRWIWDHLSLRSAP